MPRPPRILSIAGSDPSGGAGVQADIKTITALGGYAMAAITALTVQNTRGVKSVNPIEPALVIAQAQAAAQDIGVDAVKIGLLPTAAMARAVLDFAQSLGVPVVLDPVGISGTGQTMQDNNVAAAFKEARFGRALITPNLAEAALLSGISVDSEATMEQAGRTLLDNGACAVLVTGGHLAGDTCIDLLVTEHGTQRFSAPRIETSAGHGTGCTLSSALAVGLGAGLDLSAAAEQARTFVRQGLQNAPGFGAGTGPLGYC